RWPSPTPTGGRPRMSWTGAREGAAFAQRECRVDIAALRLASAAARLAAFRVDYIRAREVSADTAGAAGLPRVPPGRATPRGGERFQQGLFEERAGHCRLLRDIFPVRPVAPDPPWRTPQAVTLAATMYESRNFDAMPLLADLLEAAGCPAVVSEHSRGRGPHA